VLPEVRLGFLPMPNEVHFPLRLVNARSAIAVDAGDLVALKR
jgi:hypothetical protein